MYHIKAREQQRHFCGIRGTCSAPAPPPSPRKHTPWETIIHTYMTFFNCWLLLQLTDQPSDGSRQAINFEVNLLYLSCSLLDASRLHSLRLSPRLLVALALFIAISPLFSALKFIRNRQATQALMLPLPLPPSNTTHGFILYERFLGF